MRNNRTRAMFIILMLATPCLLLTACSTKKNLVGIWRLESGKFNDYENCVLELTNIGEYIIYDGPGYQYDRQHGSYTYDEKQIDLVESDYFHRRNNYLLEGDSLTIITSNGKAVFTKVNINSGSKAMDRAEVISIYVKEGYNILESKLISSSETSRVYQTIISKSYNYVDIQTTKKDQYDYSKFGEYWYLVKSEDVDSIENWHGIVGHYDFTELSFAPRLLDITYFDGIKITLSFYADGYISSPVRIDGTFDVLKREYYDYQDRESKPTWIVRLDYVTSSGRTSHWSDLRIDRDKGVIYN